LRRAFAKNVASWVACRVADAVAGRAACGATLREASGVAGSWLAGGSACEVSGAGAESAAPWVANGAGFRVIS